MLHGSTQVMLLASLKKCDNVHKTAIFTLQVLITLSKAVGFVLETDTLSAQDVSLF